MTTTDTTPATVSDATPAPLVADDDPWSSISDGDLDPAAVHSIPLLPMDRKIGGGIVHPDTGERVTELDFVWLAKARSRAYFPDAFGKGSDAPVCRSFDAQKPDPRSPELQNDVCPTCPHSTWNGDDPPACRESIEAMVFLPDPLGFGRLARIRFGGIAVAPSRAYWESFSARMPRRPPMAYVTKMVLEPTDTKNGKFLVPRFERVDEVPFESAKPLIEERDRRIEEWRNLVAGDVVAQSAANGDSEADLAPTTVVDDSGREF